VLSDGCCRVVASFVVVAQLVEKTSTLYERRNRLRHEERLKIDAMRRHKMQQETKKGLELQVKAKRVQAELERQREKAFAAKLAQDAVYAEAAIAQREVRKIEQQLEHRRELEAQLEQKRRDKIRGVNSVGDGVTPLEWALNSRMHEV